MFSVYLWKEWREFRWILIGLTILVPIVHIFGWYALEPKDCWVDRDPLSAFLPAIFTALVIINIFCCDLVSREKYQGRLGLLCRLPGDTSHPFWAKVTLLTATIIASWLLCLFTMILLDIDLRALNIHLFKIFHVEESDLYLALGAVLLLFLALGYMGMAISSWLPTSTMVVPTTLLIFVTYCLPYTLIWMPSWIAHGVPKEIVDLSKAVKPFPFDFEFALILFLFLPVASLIVAHLSFSGFKKGGTNLRAVSIGFPTLMLCSLLLLLWCCVRHDAWHEPRINSAEFKITNTIIGQNGHFAFLNVSNRGVRNGLILDLETNELKVDEGPSGEYFIFDRHASGKFALIQQHRFDRSFGHSYCPRYVGKSIEEGKIALWDCTSGKRVMETDRVELPDFNWGLVHVDGVLSNHYSNKPRIETWGQLIQTRNELESADRFRSLYIGNNYFIFNKKIDDPDPVHSMRCFLYDTENRKILPLPEGYYRGNVGYKTLNYHNGDTLVCSVTGSQCPTKRNEEFISEMIPCGKQWLIVKSPPITADSNQPSDYWRIKSIDIWYPATNQYETRSFLKDVGDVRSQFSSDWISVSEHTGDRSYLINRNTIEKIEIPGYELQHGAVTRGGNLIAMGFEKHGDRKRNFLSIDTKSGKCRAIRIDKKSYARFAGVIDKNVVYMRSHGTLYKLDFTDQTIEVVMPLN